MNRYAKAKAEGKLYGGRKVETRRRIGRERSRKRDETRRAAGLCTGCGRHPPRRGRRELRVLPPCASCRRAGALCLAPRRRAVRHVRGPHDRRRVAVRALRPRRDRALSEEERRTARGVRQTPRRGAVHRLRGAFPGGRALRALRPPVARALGLLPGDAGLRPAVHRRRPRDRRRARPLRLLGGRRAGDGLRPAASRPGRGDHRRPGDRLLRGMDLTPHARAAGRRLADPRSAAGPRRPQCESPPHRRTISHEPFRASSPISPHWGRYFGAGPIFVLSVSSPSPSRRSNSPPRRRCVSIAAAVPGEPPKGPRLGSTSSVECESLLQPHRRRLLRPFGRSVSLQTRLPHNTTTPNRSRCVRLAPDPASRAPAPTPRVAHPRSRTPARSPVPNQCLGSRCY